MFLHKSFTDQLSGALQIPCSACSWTPDQQASCRYFSHVKLVEGVSDRGFWTIGSRLILKERGNNPPKVSTRNLRFIKENTSIPVPTIIEEWVEDNGRYFTIETRLPGKELREAWPTMSEEQKHRVAKQTADYAKQLRVLHSDSIQSLGGEGVYDAFLFGEPFTHPHGPISSDDELWAELEKKLSHVPQEARQRLRKKMPPAAPYTFTHGFLLPWSIMVEDGNVTGFTNWETSGYFPCWWESARTQLCYGIEDMEFHSFLAQYMPRNVEADEFFVDLVALRRGGKSGDKLLSERRSQLLMDDSKTGDMNS